MQEKVPELSIIVPVYQVEKYLKECVESIEKQTFTDREIILVDDGSKDSSGRICDALADVYPDIRVIHKENGGLASARNAGLSVARGNYVGFVDSDDLIEPDMYETLLQALHNTGSRVACCSWYRLIDSKEGRKLVLPPEAETQKARTLSAEEAVRELLLDKGMTYSACDKVFDRSLFENHLFPEENLPSEDIPCIYGIISECERIVHIALPKYLYRVVQGSISTSLFQEKNISTFEYMEEVESDVMMRFPKLAQEARYALMQSTCAIYTRLLESGMEKHFRPIAKRLKKAIRKRLAGSLTNSYFSRNAKVGNILVACNLYPLFMKLKKRATQ